MDTNTQEFDYEANPKFPEEAMLAYPDPEGEGFDLELDHFDPIEQEDKLWKARTGLNEETLCGALETVIFMSDRPVSLEKMKKLIDEDLPLRVLHTALTRLQEEYEQKHHGIRLQEVAEGYQFRTKATYSKFIQDLFKVNSLVLSPTALEVLAIIAYKQPVSKIEVEKIRGVDSSHIVRGLMDKRLVKVAGRSDEVGRPVLYGTTKEFLEVFNLADLGELPPEHELEEMVMEGVGKISDIKTLVHSNDKEKFVFDEMEELETLSESIKSISSDTEFTKELSVEEKRRKKESGEQAKSAFDLLEEYVEKKRIEDANKSSSESELFTAVTQPWVVEDLTAPDLNAPEETEDEDFQMIDLETGEAIESDLNEDEFDVIVDLELTEEEAEELKAEMAKEEATESVEENPSTEEIFKDINAEELSAALDKAFEDLTGEKLEEDNSELDLQTQKVTESEENLDAKTDEAIEKAEDLDLDLSFLKDSQDTENSRDLD